VAAWDEVRILARCYELREESAFGLGMERRARFDAEVGTKFTLPLLLLMQLDMLDMHALLSQVK